MIFKRIIFFLVMAYFSLIFADDTIWLCRDTAPEVMFYKMYLSDTFPDNRGMFYMVDTGDTFAGHYINFDYQFGNPHPGYAGFKIFWDYGSCSFWMKPADSMVLWHKGPLPGHKVRMIWGQASAGCGTPINYQYFGEFKSSTTWKREIFGFPEKRNYGSAPDSPFVTKGLFELRFLIYNDSSSGNISETSEPGNLKIDNIYFIKNSTGVINHQLELIKKYDNSRYFIPTVSGIVTLSIFSLHGDLLSRKHIDVIAGKKYEVNKFARRNSKLPSKRIECIQINGSGVNITKRMFR